MVKSASDYEKLFDQICGQLAELSHAGSLPRYQWPIQEGDNVGAMNWSERLEKMQSQIRKSQDELMLAQALLQDKIGNLENLSILETDSSAEIMRLSGQLEQERQINSKLNTELAKSLELNLKLQFDIEEVRSRANQVLAEEKKHNQHLMEKNRGISHELELAQAMCQDARLELNKAREKFQSDLKSKEEEIEQISDSLSQFETHSQQQQGLMKCLSEVAEKKIIELKVGMDKRQAEAQDYYSHLQQALSQVSIFRQENQALKEYIEKLTTLQQNGASL